MNFEHTSVRRKQQNGVKTMVIKLVVLSTLVFSSGFVFAEEIKKCSSDKKVETALGTSKLNRKIRHKTPLAEFTRQMNPLMPTYRLPTNNNQMIQEFNEVIEPLLGEYKAALEANDQPAAQQSLQKLSGIYYKYVKIIDSSNRKK